MLEAEGIDRERVVSVDRQKVDEALEVTTLTESDVYEIDESEYVRKGGGRRRRQGVAPPGLEGPACCQRGRQKPRNCDTKSKHLKSVLTTSQASGRGRRYRDDR